MTETTTTTLLAAIRESIRKSRAARREAAKAIEILNSHHI